MEASIRPPDLNLKEYLPVALAAEANKSENFIFRKFYIEFVELILIRSQNYAFIILQLPQAFSQYFFQFAAT